MFKSNMNFNLYKTFYDVARYGSFSKAAEFTYSTQPAISKSIQKLEAELETKLFIRKPNGVELTEKGRELLFYVEKSYGNLLTAERVMLERDNLNRGKLSIGVPSNLYSFMLFDYVRDFHQKYPNIEISIITGSTTFLLNQLELHKIDFIVDTSPINTVNNDLTIKELTNLNYCFISNDKKDLKIKSISELNNRELILPIEGSSNRIQINELFIKNNLENINSINLHTSEMIIDAVKNGMGIGYVISDMVPSDLYKLNLKEELPTVQIVLVYNKKFLTSSPKTFINTYFKV